MGAPQPQDTIDPEDTATGGFLFGEAGGGRQVLSAKELLARLTQLIRSCEGCENVTVIEGLFLDPADSRDGCNWSLGLMLDPGGVAPEVYALGYGAIIATARSSWNVEEPKSGSEPEPADA